MANRRQAIAAIAALLALPAFAQQPGKVSRIGVLSPNRRTASMASQRIGAFVAGLRDLGYVEGKNLAIEWQFAEEAAERLPAMAAELVKLKVDAIVTAGTPASRAAQKATSTIPIVMLAVGDPVGSGLVDSLARPGKNITGVSVISSDLSAKWFEIARNIVPNLERVGVLLNSANPAYPATLDSAWKATRATNILVYPAEVKSSADFERAFTQLKRAGVGALVVQNDGLFVDGAKRLAELATAMRLPVVSGRWELAQAGLLVSYGSNVAQVYRRGASQVDKILKGAKAGDLPVELPTDFELVVNLRTAKAIGVTVPKELLVRADRVIE